MATTAKAALLERFERVILEPRRLDYRVQFPGPTGTNAVEAALKLARKVTGRTLVVSFTNGYHGMTLGSLAATGNRGKRSGAGQPLSGTVALPYDGYLGPSVDTLQLIERLLEDPSSGLDLPAAFLVETVQAEGGVRVASTSWLRGLERLARRHGALLIVDDIQVGCGRTGTFFSFEEAGLRPDLVCLSKSISGYGLPMALVLLRPELDLWKPGEHNGTFRGNNLAFLAATEALSFWETDELQRQVLAHGALIAERLAALARCLPSAEVRGRGMIQGLVCGELAQPISRAAFERGLIIETAGPKDEVLKVLPPLTIGKAELCEGLDLLEDAVQAVGRG